MSYAASIGRLVDMTFIAGTSLLLTSSLQSSSRARASHTATAASVYRYDGVVYDRLFSVLEGSGDDNGSFALAVNDADVSVGKLPVHGITSAALFAFSAMGGDERPKALLPPKHTEWIGTATGLNDAGVIVGYTQINPLLRRHVRFFVNGNGRS